MSKVYEKTLKKFKTHHIPFHTAARCVERLVLRVGRPDGPQLSAREIEEVVWAYRERIVDLKRDTRFEYILVFKNHGVGAGATLEHEHSQLIALPIVPREPRAEIDAATHSRP